jgi:hypothetical protein
MDHSRVPSRTPFLSRFFAPDLIDLSHRNREVSVGVRFSRILNVRSRNMDYEIPLTTKAAAKQIFQAMGCTHFHMMRDFPERYREYQSFGINKYTERKWTSEAIRDLLAKLIAEDTPPKDRWWIHRHVTDLVLTGGFDNRLKPLLVASAGIDRPVSQFDRLLVAETIVGRQAAQYRSGMIYRCHDIGKPQLAQSYAEIAEKLVRKPFRSVANEKRRQELLVKLDETTSACGVRIR